MWVLGVMKGLYGILCNLTMQCDKLVAIDEPWYVLVCPSQAQEAWTGLYFSQNVPRFRGAAMLVKPSRGTLLL